VLIQILFIFYFSLKPFPPNKQSRNHDDVGEEDGFPLSGCAPQFSASARAADIEKRAEQHGSGAYQNNHGVIDFVRLHIVSPFQTA